MLKIRSILHAVALAIIGQLPAPAADGTYARINADSRARNRRRARKRTAAERRLERTFHRSAFRLPSGGAKIARMAADARIGKCWP